MKSNSPALVNKLLYIETFGCQMNVSDSEKMATILRGLGYVSTNLPDDADLIILNTCSVRAKAEQKLFSQLGRYRGLKKKNRSILIGVAGCLAQQEGEKLLKRVPFLDLVVGTHNLHALADVVAAAESGERVVNVEFIDNDTRIDLFPQTEADGTVSRFITIMQGCDNFCTYCIVPYVRGREISRRSTEILSEIKMLAENGVKEITLLGQNVNSYGTRNDSEISFASLLREVSGINGIERIRFTTSHPKDLSAEVISCFNDLPKLCGHIHLPAQSGSDKILNRMERGYTRAEYLARIKALVAVRPDIQVTGDMIVGFPGETEEDFAETISLMQEVRYADLFSFIYSARPETRAASYPDQLTYREKQERLSILQKHQKEMTLERNLSFVGSIQKILVEGKSKQESQMFGRTEGNRIVNFESEDNSLVGRITDVLITKAHQNSLLGRVVTSADIEA